MNNEDFWTCDDCERKVSMERGWNVSTCEKTGASLCARCIRVRIRERKAWHGCKPTRGERSVYVNA